MYVLAYIKTLIYNIPIDYVYIMCSNIFLASVLKGFKIFVGVFACDELHTITPSKREFSSIIVNTEKSTSNKAGHWILLTYFRKNKKLVYCEIFDSLAQNIYDFPILIVEYIRLLDVPVKYSHTQIQSYFSDFCGLFCIARFLSILSGEDLDKFTKYFNNKFLNRNNKISVEYIFNHIKP